MAIIVLAIAFSALAAALVSGMVATSRASQLTEAKQIAAKQIETLHSVKWALLGLYKDETGAAWSDFNNGESVVKLADNAPATRPADVPRNVTTVTGHGGKQYTVTTWVTWAGSSTATPNDGTTYAKKRLWVQVSYTPRGSAAKTVQVEDFRAPTPLEMQPPSSAAIVPVTLANPVFTPSRPAADRHRDAAGRRGRPGGHDHGRHRRHRRRDRLRRHAVHGRAHR